MAACRHPLAVSSRWQAWSLAAGACVVAQPFAAARLFRRLPRRISPSLSPQAPPRRHAGADAVQAGIDYDYANERVSAVGNARILNGLALEANKVVYDQKTKRLRAEGMRG